MSGELSSVRQDSFLRICRQRWICWIWMGVMLLCSGPSLEAQDEPRPTPSLSQQKVVEGLRITLQIDPFDGQETLIDGTDARVTFTIEDANSGEPLVGLHPLAWMHRREGKEAPSENRLKEMIAEFLGGLLSVTADHDLNQYFLLVLNGDRSISIIDPLISFSITKLRSLIGLPGEPVDWVLNSDKEQLLVTLPDENKVVVIDANRARIASEIEFGEGSEPVRLLLEPTGEAAWVSLDGTDQLARVDLRTLEVGPVLDLGSGRHTTAIDSDSRWLAATSTADGIITIIDLHDDFSTRTVKVGETPIAIAYAPLSARFLVASANGDTLHVIDPQTSEKSAGVKIPRGVIDIELEPSGRFAFLASPSAGVVVIVDTARGEITGSVTTALAPDEVVCSNSFAYIHDAERANIILVDLNRLSRDELVVTELGIGRKSMSDVSVGRQITSLLAPPPEGSSMFVANPGDKLVYYYVEGMMASMGNFQTYSRIPRGILVLDRSLQETGPGEYSTVVRFDKVGVLDVPFLIDQPRTVTNFQLEVKPIDSSIVELELVPVNVTYLEPKEVIRAGTSVDLQLKVTDSVSGEPVDGLKDVKVMLFALDGSHQDRLIAEGLGEGVYQFKGTFREQVRFGMMIEVPSRGLTFKSSVIQQIAVYPAEARK